MPTQVEQVPLTVDDIYNAMRKYMEAKTFRYNDEMMRQYVTMRLPAVKGAKRRKLSRYKSTDTITSTTVKDWCHAFLDLYNNK